MFAVEGALCLDRVPSVIIFTVAGSGVRIDGHRIGYHLTVDHTLPQGPTEYVSLNTHALVVFFLPRRELRLKAGQGLTSVTCVVPAVVRGTGTFWKEGFRLTFYLDLDYLDLLPNPSNEHCPVSTWLNVIKWVTFLVEQGVLNSRPYTDTVQGVTGQEPLPVWHICGLLVILGLQWLDVLPRYEKSGVDFQELGAYVQESYHHFVRIVWVELNRSDILVANRRLESLF